MKNYCYRNRSHVIVLFMKVILHTCASLWRYSWEFSASRFMWQSRYCGKWNKTSPSL